MSPRRVSTVAARMPPVVCSSGCPAGGCPTCWLAAATHWHMALQAAMPTDRAPVPCPLTPSLPTQLRLLRVHGPLHHGCGHCGPARHAGGAWCSKEAGPLGCRAVSKKRGCLLTFAMQCHPGVLHAANSHPPTLPTSADGRPQPDRQARQLGGAGAAGAAGGRRGGDACAGGTRAAAGWRHSGGQAHACR